MSLAPVRLLVGLLVLLACSCGDEATPTLTPVGTWEVADPESVAQAQVQQMKDQGRGSLGSISIDEYLGTFRRSLQRVVIEFKPDGTVLHSDRGPWDRGTWSQVGSQVWIRVDRYGDTPIPLGLEYVLTGATLVETGVAIDYQPGRSREPQASGAPHVVLRRTQRSVSSP